MTSKRSHGQIAAKTGSALAAADEEFDSAMCPSPGPANVAAADVIDVAAANAATNATAAAGDLL